MKAFCTNGPGRNVDPKVALMRKAGTAATHRYSSGGIVKRNKPRDVTLPTLDSLRKLSREARNG
jgi:hypothetical protein